MRYLMQKIHVSYGPGLITWWMLDLWFGLDASGFDKATTFHPVFGPALMVTYACLSNTLLLTVLVSILSNTFASVNEDAAAEAMFRKAVSTIEGVKADSLFSYQPPVNLVALCIMLPASYILSPRWFHKVNVFMIRLTSFPILLGISLYERQSKKAGTLTFYDTVSHMAESVFDTLPRSMKRMTFFEGLAGVDGDIDAVFEIEDAFDSALDIGDNNDGFSVLNHRRLSGASSRGGRPNVQTSPPKNIARARLNSIMTRAEAYSPLAQVFNPLLLEDDHAREANNASSSTTTGVSYGPASRRRLTSIHTGQHRRVTHDGLMQSMQKKFPVMNDKSSPPDRAFLRSRSHERYTSPSSTAGEIKDAEDNSGEDPNSAMIINRLEEMERRQVRIEELLTQISQNLKSGGN
ncbi:hypothetical protein D9613_007044 [Agrocybe pediades]|uniref:Calcium channel YVC1-like C-terminal transmembrane domain-containing protein n=1 Tax=Agrocybe pediades TaxID=84607 RepID=A0A8H4VII2_9AGAR|nr:hypothetical protein D9613_007044 [Agrocybe pediades]